MNNENQEALKLEPASPAGATSANQLAQTTTEEKLWPCPYCEKTFTDHRKRIGHVRAMHPGMPVPRRSPEEVRLLKIEENRRRREKFWALGLTSGGTPRKTGFRRTPRKPLREPSMLSKMSNRERYLYYKERNRIRGLNAKGQPFKRTVAGLTTRGQPFKVSRTAATNIAHAQKMRRQRERREKERLLNGTAPLAQAEPQQPQDNLGDSARAIIMAAQVLRSVSIGMKL